MVRRADLDRIDIAVGENVFKPGDHARIADQSGAARRFVPVNVTADNDSGAVACCA
jgi:hypothetical protein